MIDENKLNKLVYERAKLEPNNPKVEFYWDKISCLLSINEDETIEFLNKCDAKTIGWIGEVFDDISYKLQNIKFINCIKLLKEKYPEINLEWRIKCAIDMLE